MILQKHSLGRLVYGIGTLFRQELFLLVSSTKYHVNADFSLSLRTIPPEKVDEYYPEFSGTTFSRRFVFPMPAKRPEKKPEKKTTSYWTLLTRMQ